MRIACCLRVPDAEARAWLAAFGAALPEARVEIWHPGSAPGDYLVAWRPSQECLDAHARAKAIFNAGAGVDALLAMRVPDGVPIFRLEDAGMGEQMAEYVLYAVVRHFREFDAYERQAKERIWKSRAPRDRRDHPVGVLGVGVLGLAIARALQGQGFPVRGWSRTPKAIPGLEVLGGKERLEEFLRGSRILVCVLPLTSETHGILDRHTLAALPHGAYVINVARGGLIVEDDLLDALDREAVVGRQRLPGGDIEERAGERFPVERIEEIVLHDEAAARDVDHIGAVGQRRQRMPVEDAARLGGQGQHAHEDA